MLDQTIAVNQYVTFSLGKELYGVSVRNVREVLDLVTITRVPGMPPYMKGVLNLRGSVVPVIALRKKFNMSAVEDTVETSIIIMELEENGETHLMGVFVDSVHEVLEIRQEEIEPAPEMGLQLDSRFIQGMKQKDSSFMVLLDVNRLLTGRELSAITAVGEAAGELVE